MSEKGTLLHVAGVKWSWVRNMGDKMVQYFTDDTNDCRMIRTVITRRVGHLEQKIYTRCRDIT